MIETYGRTGIVSDETTGFTYELTSNPREFDSFKLRKEELGSNLNTFTVGEWRILPYGSNDNLPWVISNAVKENSTAPGIIEKKINMYLGTGLCLYKEEIKDNQVVRTLVEDKDIKSWLDSWKAEQYIYQCAVDYEHMKSHFGMVYRNRASRNGGESKIAKLEHIDMNDARLACHISSTDLIPTHIVVTDFTFNTIESLTDMKVYPLFDSDNPFDYPTAAYYARQYTFGDKFYTTPALYGILEWLRRSTATPIIFKALSKHSINVKYHVESPQAFWDDEQERLEKNASAAGKEFTDNDMVAYRNQFMKELLKVLATDENTGKVWHTRKK